MQRDSTYDTQGATARDAPARDGGWRGTYNKARSLRVCRYNKARVCSAGWRTFHPLARCDQAMPDTRAQSFAGLHGACTNVRAPFRTILMDKIAAKLRSLPQHMARASSSSLSTAVLHSVGARRDGGAGTYVPRAELEQSARCYARARAQAASSGTGAAAVNRAWLRFVLHGWTLLPLMPNLRDCCHARARRAVRCRAGAQA